MKGSRDKPRFTIEQTVTGLLVLGFLPFAFLASLMLVDLGIEKDPIGTTDWLLVGVIVALKAYSAVVLAFIAGIRWGIAITRPHPDRGEYESLFLSSALSIVGWFAFFLDDPWSFAVFAVAFAAAGWWDSRISGTKDVPSWFGRLRILFTVLVMATMIAAFAATYTRL